jgi:hypothetical protein
MIERVSVDLTRGRLTLLGAVFRYEVVQRLSRVAAERGVRLVAFGFAENELRLVLEGEPDDIGMALMALKLGTVRAAARWGLEIRSGRSKRFATQDLFVAVVWAHRGPVEAGAADPLASPWSSHRDVLGFRRAAFYDPAVLAGRIDPRKLHRACGGTRLPSGWPPKTGTEDLGLLLRIAGAVLGVLPADRRCFRLFVHLAKSRGFTTSEVAEALSLTSRRVRQLAADAEPELPLALAVLGSPVLQRVP